MRKKSFILFLSSTLISFNINSATLYSITNGDWSTSGTWSTTSHAGPSCGCTPGSNDVVFVGGGDNVTFTVDLNLNAGAQFDDLTVEAGATLTGDGSSDLTVNGNGTLVISGTLTAFDGTFDNNSNVTINGGGLLHLTNDLTNNNNSDNIVVNGTIQVDGNLDVGNGSDITGSGIVNVDGTVTIGGSGEVLGCDGSCCINDCVFPIILPIELIDFEATVNNDDVDLYWITASETNNDFFTIERSKDGKYFEELVRVTGAGNSTGEIDYMEKDYDPYDGVSYYRLKQTDFDGTYTYSQTVAVKFIERNPKEIQVFPNPVLFGNDFNVSLKGFEKNEEVFVVVRDIAGKKLYSKIIITEADQNTITAINPSQSLPVGIYTITGSTSKETLSKKLIVQ